MWSRKRSRVGVRRYVLFFLLSFRNIRLFQEPHLVILLLLFCRSFVLSQQKTTEGPLLTVERRGDDRSENCLVRHVASHRVTQIRSVGSFGYSPGGGGAVLPSLSWSSGFFCPPRSLLLSRSEASVVVARRWED